MEFELRVRPDVLGARLKAARMVSRMTQGAAANELSMARTTIVAIEAGKRPVSLNELRSLAELYDVSEVDLLDDGASSMDMQVQFRSNAPSEGTDEESLVAAMLNRLANSVVQLEALVGMPAPQVDVPFILLSREGSVEQQAEDAAGLVRARLGLGMGPIQDINALLESELGLRVFERLLPSRISGAIALSEAAGGFILLNLKHPIYRRRVTAAHELAHAALKTTGLKVHFEDDSFEDREERFCDVFGSCLLMPAPSVRKKAAELKQLVGRFTVRELLTMTLYFNVSMEALVRRMVSLKLLPPGAYERLKADGLSMKHQAIVREELGLASMPPSFTARTMLLAIAAHERELLTEQQIASMLELDLLTVRKALDRDGQQGQGESLELVP
ncbi:helix-turn-helix domain-containing protein [Variovorax sp.]|uniref:helix-turn-helix domain-containing protein n=1 Tax=Variovorax sp. TaxID=1871043 RepID=UPI003BAC0CB9